ncbi:MAG: hypothetical protein ACYS0D_11110 [Planctomycetota bacterium]
MVSVVQAVGGAAVLVWAAKVDLLAAILIVTGLIGFLAQEPRYDGSSMKATAIGLNLVALSYGALQTFVAAVAVLWDGRVQAIFLLSLAAVIACGVNATCILILDRETGLPAGP